MRTGTSAFEERKNDPAMMGQILLCFLAVYERQVLCRAFTYMYHNYLESEEDFDKCTILSLKYSTLSPHGIAVVLRPYLQLAMGQGFLTPEDCEDNVFAYRVHSLFPSVYKEWKTKGEEAAQAMVMKYVFEILTDPIVATQEALLAGDVDQDEDDQDVDQDEDDQDVDQDEDDQDADQDKDDQGGDDQGDDQDEDQDDFECLCDFCEEFRSFDTVNLNDINPSDPIDAVIINGMKKALKL